MRNFTESSNAIMLHGIISSISLIYEGDPVAWINTSERTKTMYDDAIRDAHKLNEGDDTWYETHWQIFPFGEPTYENLSDVNRDLVITAGFAVYSLAHCYGAQLRGVNE